MILSDLLVLIGGFVFGILTGAGIVMLVIEDYAVVRSEDETSL